jgi:hypothetical protein
MPTQSFFTTDANDGSGRITADSYPPGGGFIPDDSTTLSAYRFLMGASPIHWVGNGFVRFDTGAVIPITDTVDSATLKLYCVDSDKDGSEAYELLVEAYDFGGEATVQADISVSATGAVATPIALPLAFNTLHSIPITDLSVIKKATQVNAQGFTGITGFRIKLSIDAAATNTNNYVDFASSEHATHPAPELEVVYSTPGGGGSGHRRALLLGVG